MAVFPTQIATRVQADYCYVEVTLACIHTEIIIFSAIYADHWLLTWLPDYPFHWFSPRNYVIVSRRKRHEQRLVTKLNIFLITPGSTL